MQMPTTVPGILMSAALTGGGVYAGAILINKVTPVDSAERISASITAAIIVGMIGFGWKYK
jgi:hypothetical protein